MVVPVVAAAPSPRLGVRVLVASEMPERPAAALSAAAAAVPVPMAPQQAVVPDKHQASRTHQLHTRAVVAPEATEHQAVAALAAAATAHPTTQQAAQAQPTAAAAVVAVVTAVVPAGLVALAAAVL
jgi:hypothetical protein